VTGSSAGSRSAGSLPTEWVGAAQVCRCANTPRPNRRAGASHCRAAIAAGSAAGGAACGTAGNAAAADVMGKPEPRPAQCLADSLGPAGRAGAAAGQHSQQRQQQLQPMGAPALHQQLRATAADATAAVACDRWSKVASAACARRKELTIHGRRQIRRHARATWAVPAAALRVLVHIWAGRTGSLRSMPAGAAAASTPVQPPGRQQHRDVWAAPCDAGLSLWLPLAVPPCPLLPLPPGAAAAC
jgi:hypothetical protein